MGCRLWGRTESDTTDATWQQEQQQQRCMSVLLSIHPTLSFPPGPHVCALLWRLIPDWKIGLINASLIAQLIKNPQAFQEMPI